LAEKLVDLKRPGSFNQSLMELGATVCTAQSPECEKCPIREYCNAYSEVEKFKENNKKALAKEKKRKEEKRNCVACGEYGPTESVTKYPTKVKKTAQRPESVATAIVECN
jgi:A/G-specific adenine glycosylase